jgi:cytochrome c
MKSLRLGLIVFALSTGLAALPLAAAEETKPRGASERAKAKRANALLDRAVALYKEKGDTALPAFAPGGAFIDGEYYVYIVGTDGIMYASAGPSVTLVGKNVTDLKDDSGKPFMRDLIAAGKTQGAGMVEYRWLNPSDGKVEPKSAIFRKVGDKILAVGYYIPRANAEEAKVFFDKAVAFAQKEGVPNACKVFNDPKGPFVSGDLYVFVVGLKDGKYCAQGQSPTQTGRDVSAMTDAMGKPIIRDMMNIAKTKGEGTYTYVWRNPATNRVEDKTAYVKNVDDYLLGVGYYSK